MFLFVGFSKLVVPNKTKTNTDLLFHLHSQLFEINNFIVGLHGAFGIHVIPEEQIPVTRKNYKENQIRKKKTKKKTIPDLYKARWTRELS